MDQQSKSSTAFSSPQMGKRLSKIINDSPYIREFEQMIRNSSGKLDIYEFFSGLSKKVEINLPETLLKLPRTEPIFMLSNKGHIEVKRKNCISEFFTKNTCSDGYPQFIHISEEGINISYNTKEALRSWSSCKAPKHMMQKFVIPPSKIPTKVRVHWMSKAPVRFFQVQNSSMIPKGNIKRYNISGKKPSKYMHSLREFPYAGQLFKTSFNSFLPEKSSINGIRKRATKISMIGEYQKFLYTTKFSSETGTIQEIEKNEQINKMIEEFIRQFNEQNQRYDKRVLSEVLLDFIQDYDEKWYLLKCKAYTIDYLPTKVILNPLMSPELLKKSIITTDFVKDFYNSIKNRPYINKAGMLTPENLQQRLKKIESRSIDFHIKGPFIDINDIKELNINYYKNNKPDFIYASPSRETPSSNILNLIAERYDEYRQNTKSSLK